MYKRIKKYNLNTSDKQHGRLMLKNLFTSLLLNGRVETTYKKAKELKRFAQAQIGYYNKKHPPMVLKTWLKDIIQSRKYFDKAVKNLETVAKDFKITNVRTRNRAGDNALMMEVKIINFKK